MSKPRLFIASSTENLDVAYAAQANLEADAEVIVWDQGIFDLSSYILEGLLQELDRADFGLFIFAPEDTTRIRGEDNRTVRDNVVLELGLFVGRLGRESCFILQPSGSQQQRTLPDLSGLIVAKYDPNRIDENWRAALQTACYSIRNRIRPKDGTEKRMNWSTYYSAVWKLSEEIAKTPKQGGFRPHLMIGVNEGGSMIGGLLYYYLRWRVHFTVWTYDDWDSPPYDTQKNELINIIQQLPKPPRFEKRRILLVDDSFKTGTSVGRAWYLVDEAIEQLKMKEDTEIKTAVIVYRSDLRDQSKGPSPDYYVYQDYTHFPFAPV